jgi:hypothetical protein
METNHPNPSGRPVRDLTGGEVESYNAALIAESHEQLFASSEQTLLRLSAR